MMEIILNREVLNDVNVQIRSLHIVKIFIVKRLNDYICLKYPGEKDIMILYVGNMDFPGLEKNG